MVMFRPFMQEQPNGVGPELTEIKHLKFYPNPASERIWLDVPHEAEGEEIPYYIFDTSGRQLRHGFVLSNSIDISNLEAGLYYIRARISGEAYYSKVLITR